VSYGGLVGLASEACLCLLFIVLVLFTYQKKSFGVVCKPGQHALRGGWDVYVVVLSFDYGMDVSLFLLPRLPFLIVCPQH
jgi:hypothetical protein